MRSIFILVMLCMSFHALHAATVVATGSGKWSQGNNWSTGNPPLSTDDVVINSGVDIWIDGNYSCRSLIINGEVYFKNHNESMTVTTDVTINSGGMFDLQSNGNGKTQTLSIGGSLTNNGTFDLYSAATLYSTLTFTGSTSANWIMNNGSTNEVLADGGVILDKGSSTTSVLSVSYNSTFTASGSTSTGFLRLLNGLFTITGNSVISSTVLGASYYSIPATAGLRLNSNSFIVSGQSGTLTNSGLLRVSAGTFKVGLASGDLLTGNGIFTFDGGTLNVASRFTSTSGQFNLSAGSVNIATVGNTISAPSLELANGSSFTTSGGSLNLVQANSNLISPIDYRVLSSTVNITGGTLNLGTTATATNFTFRIAGLTPALTIDNTSNNKTGILSTAITSYGSVTINSGTTLNTAGFGLSARGASFTNNGALSGNGTVSFDASTAQSYTGSGSVAANITINNTTGLTLNAGITFSLANTLTVAAGALLDARTFIFTFGALGNTVVNGTFYTANPAGFSGSASTAISSSNTPTITLGASSTIVYNSTSSQSVTPRAYSNLTITASGAKSLVGAASIGNSNVLTVNSGSIFDAANNTVSFGTAASASIQGSFRTSNSAGFSGTTSTALSSTNTPTISLGSSSTVQYNGTASQTITARSDYANLTISGARSGGSTITLSSGTIGLTGTFTASATNTTFSVSGNTFNYKGSSQAIAAFTYNHLDLTGATGTTFPSGTVAITGSFSPASITSATQGTINFKGAGQTIAAFAYNNLDLTTASSVNFPSGTVYIGGTFTPASVTSALQGTIEFNGSTQTVPAFTYKNLTLSNTSKSLGGLVSVSGNVSLSGGAKLLLGSYNITVAGNISGDASNFIVTNSSGSVVLRGITGAGKQLPIGANASSYSPLTIAQPSSLDWTVRVGDDISPVAVNESYAIQRMWIITPSTNPTPSATTLTFQYNEGDAGIQGANWSTSSAVALSRHNGIAWSTAASGITPTGSAGGIRTVTASGLTAFSSWVIAKNSSPLPVQLLSFSGRREGAANLLQWSTVSESDNAGFSVERSQDGRNFSQIAFVPSQAPGGNSSTLLSYQYSDRNMGPGAYYYRLRQEDRTNGFSYSGVVRIEADPQANGILTIAPNPSKGAVQIQLRAKARTLIQVILLDMRGRQLQRSEHTLEAGTTTLPMTLDGLPAGAYLLQVQFGDGFIARQQLVKQ